MANQTTHEPRALTAALAAPPFHTLGGGGALHAADRHVERWAPEAGASRVRSMRSLSFVDRLVAPWIETAQRSASLRLFSQYARSGVGEREGGAVSWVFPRPWYQDELDWMAAARQVGGQSAAGRAPAPTMLTTRGTYVPSPRQDASASQMQPAMPSALYEYVAPSLSIAAPTQSIAGIGYGGSYDGGGRGEAYSPLVSLAAVQAAELMSRTVAPMVSTPSGTTATVGRISPALRAVLTTMLERAAVSRGSSEVAPTRSSMYAPELVTPPAPRAPRPETPETPSVADHSDGLSPSQLADRYAEQRTRIVELQRIARQSSERESVARIEAARASEASRAEPARAEETRATAQRIEAELRQRTADRGPVTETQQRQAQAERAQVTETQQRQAQAERAQVERAQVERARIEDKLAQRSGAQRLHEQSRTEAAAHARAAAFEAAAAVAAPPAMPEYRPPAEVTAAIAGLPPELAAFLAHRPERAMQAVTELNDLLRTAELLARSAAANTPFEATRGPRLMMPAGLGGLVAAVDRAQSIADRPAQLAGVRPIAPMIAPQAAPPTRAPARGDARVPSLPWLVGPSGAPQMSAASTTANTAFGATASAAPAGLAHVAWADRWLARFAGATPQSLDVLQAASAGSPHLRMQALAAAAPGEVFVSPIFDTENVRTRTSMPIQSAPFAQEPGATASIPTRIPSPSLPPAERYDDSAETPDDVFVQIAAAAASKRASSVTPSIATQETTTAGGERYTLADAVAHAAPSAPGAGLSAQLASSPFASALRHVLPLPAAASFDVRALFGAGLSSTFLAGLLASESHEMEIAGATSPMWASWGGADTAAAPIEREAPSFDATYVSPDVERGRDARFDDMADVGAAQGTTAAAAAVAMEPLTTLRTALLSWTMAMEPGALASLDAPSISTNRSAPITTAAARAMIESMSLPMLGDAATPRERMASWSSPGMLAERAQSWSVAQERSASDLSLDFVTPELLLAARVYGLGPAEAAQAARLAIAGPGQLTAMAGAVDRTFVQAMAIEADRREGRTTGASGATSGTSGAMVGAPSRPTSGELAAMSPEARAAISTAYPTASGEIVAFDTATPARMYSSPGAAFGVERRAPRGAFLWPSATVAALGLHAASPDGLQSMPLAALELLAAQAVAEIGTYAALGEHPFAPSGDGGQDVGVSELSASGDRRASMRSMQMPSVGGGEDGMSEPGEADVLGAAAALVPASRRARFDALYVALSQSSTGRTWSPASRAARALALAGRGDEAPTSAYERAATAWDVLPVVYATDGMALTGLAEAEPMSTGMAHTYALSGRRPGARRPGAPGEVEPMITVDGRPGLGALSARAGEALGSYVSPAGYASSSASSSSSTSSSSSSGGARESQSPIARAPTAAQELVRTGRPAGRHGGGEVEIPAWFETAARKMLEDRSGNSDGISMAEMTLVNAAPATHVAASARSAATPSAAATAPTHGEDESGKSPIDIDKTANEVYRQILTMMDVARVRNGS